MTKLIGSNPSKQEDSQNPAKNYGSVSRRERVARFFGLRSSYQEIRLLPPSVRSNLANQEARLGRSDAEALFKNGFQNLGFYLAMKAAEPDDSLQVELIKRLATYNFEFAKLEMTDVAKAFLGREQDTIKGSKLATVSKYGFENWVEIMDNALSKAEKVLPDAPLFITG